MACLHIHSVASFPCGPSSSRSLRQSYSRAPVKVTRSTQRLQYVCLAAAGASQPPAGTPDPYEVLGVHPLQPFDKVKAAYGRKLKEAEKSGDAAAVAALEGAYDKIMMKQLSNRKQGLTTGSFKVSKEIKHADRQALLPWGPRYGKSGRREVYINLAVSAVMSLWVLLDRGAEWKPLQFLIFGYVFAIFHKLQQYDPGSAPVFTEDGVEKVDMKKKGGRLLRTVAFVFGPVSFAALAFTGILNVFDILGRTIPRLLLSSQNIFVTILSSAILFFAGSFYR